MAPRASQVPFGPSPDQTGIVAQYAARQGWASARRYLIVEGTRDVDYCALAAMKFESRYGHRLLDQEFQVVASGMGEEGGIKGVVREMWHLHGLRVFDKPLDRAQQVRVVFLLDDDDAGRKAFSSTTGELSPMTRYRDVFLLKRAYPAEGLGRKYEDRVREANAKWEGLDCEMEDLLGRELLELFCQDNPNSLRCEPTVREGAHHYEFSENGKAAVLRFAKEMADLEQIMGITRTLQYFRGLFGLAVGPVERL